MNICHERNNEWLRDNVPSKNEENKEAILTMGRGLKKKNLLPTGSEEREVLGVGSIPIAILPFCQDMEAIAF